MTQPILFARNVNQELYVRALSSVYRSGYRVYEPSFAISREPDVYEKVRRDPIVAAAIDQRLHGVAGKSWIIQGFDEAEETDKLGARIVQDAFKFITNLDEARYEIAQAVIRGRSFSYPQLQRKVVSLGGTEKRAWLVPTFIEDIDRRRFRLIPQWEGHGVNRKLTVYWELFSVARERWERLERPELFIKHVYQDEEARLGYGRGLLEAIYFYHYAKTVLFKNGLQGIERWAKGILVAKIDGLREASTGKPNSALATAWTDVLNDLRQIGVVVHDKTDDLEVLTGGMQGHQLVMEMMKYLDDAVTRLILGSVLPSGGGEAGGSLARAQVEENTTEGLIQFDRRLLDGTLTRDLVGMFWNLNSANLRAVGAGDANMPKFISRQEKRKDPQKAITVIQTALASKIPLIRSEVYDAIDFTAPKADDEIIEPTEIPALPGVSPFGPSGPGLQD